VSLRTDRFRLQRIVGGSAGAPPSLIRWRVGRKRERKREREREREKGLVAVECHSGGLSRLATWTVMTFDMPLGRLQFRANTPKRTPTSGGIPSASALRAGSSLLLLDCPMATARPLQYSSNGLEYGLKLLGTNTVFETTLSVQHKKQPGKDPPRQCRTTTTPLRRV
jgi:hypothetical protein